MELHLQNFPPWKAFNPNETVCLSAPPEVEYSFGMRIFEAADYGVTTPIPIHHEASAALMAYGYARIKGKPGIVALSAWLRSSSYMRRQVASQSYPPAL